METFNSCDDYTFIQVLLDTVAFVCLKQPFIYVTLLSRQVLKLKETTKDGSTVSGSSIDDAVVASDPGNY